MNPRTLFCALLLLCPLVPLTAAEPSVLISSDETKDDAQGRAVFTGHVRAVFAGTNAMTINAASLTHDQDRHSLVCQGEAVIVCGSQTITGKDLVVDLGSNSVNVYRLDPAAVAKGGKDDAAAEHLRKAAPFAVPPATRQP